MKKSIFLLCFLSLAVSAYTQDPDEEAIKQVIAAETQAWIDGQPLSSYWHLRPWSATYASSSIEGECWAFHLEGQALAEWAEKADREKQAGLAFTNTNHKVQIIGDAAFVSYDMALSYPDDGGTYYTREFRWMERVDGEWKIVVNSSHWLRKVSAIAQNPDEEAIKRVVAAEVQGLLDGDAAAIRNAWHIQPYSALVVSSTDPDNTWSMRLEGEKFTRWLEEEKEEMAGATLTQSNHQFRMCGDMALAIFDQKIEQPGKGVFSSKEFKLLEKVDGQWRITVTSAHFADWE